MLYFILLPYDIRKYYYQNYFDLDCAYSLKDLEGFQTIISKEDLENSKFQIVNYAATNGYLKLLQWLKANGCSWNGSTCSYAAYNGHLEILKWLKVDGCYWNTYTCADAALNGHLEVLKWLRENGCPWDEYTSSYAA